MHTPIGNQMSKLMSKHTIIAFCVLWGTFVSAQQTLSEIANKYPFLQAQNAYLVHYGDSTASNHFMERFAQLNLCGDAGVSIAHFGGSHVQAGTLSRTLWRNLQTLNPDAPGAPGFVYPFHLAKTNNPSHYLSESNAEFSSIRAARPSESARWGMSAITIFTNDTSGYVRMKNLDENSSYWSFSRVRIYTPLGDSCFSIYPDSSYNVLVTNIDSTAGMIEWILDSNHSELLFHWEKRDTLQRVFYLDGVQLDKGAPGITYHAMGANGNSTKSLVRSKALWPQLKYLNADLAIFGVGINDAHKSHAEFDVIQYKNNYRQIIDSLRAHNPNIALIFMTNNDSYYKGSPNGNALRVQKAMQHLAGEYGGWVFDLFSYMGGMNASQVWHRQGLGKRDKIHFTPDGYRIHADAMYQAIKFAFFEYLQKAYPQPLIE